MSNENSLPGGSDVDDELKKALLGAFGEDAMALLDDDDDDFILDDESLSESVDSSDVLARVLEAITSDGDVSPKFRWMKQLTSSIYADGLAELAGENELPSSRPPSVPIDQRCVAFEIDEFQFGVPLADVVEIGRYPAVTELPHTPAWLRGISNYRGQILSVTDLRNLFQLSGDRPTVGERIVVVKSNVDSVCTALVVDRVLGIRAFENEQCDNSSMESSIAAVAHGTATIDDVPTVLIDTTQLFRHSNGMSTLDS